MPLIRRFLWAAVALVILYFSITNRHLVPVYLLPGYDSLPLPLYLIFFFGVFTGLITASLVTGWLRLKGFTARRKAERTAIEKTTEIESLQDELNDKRTQQMKETDMPIPPPA